jgi:hypothetical protein
MFQGLRNPPVTGEVGGRNTFRFVGRVQINLLDPETGFFYGGTYFGTKRVLSIGGSYDFQNGTTGTGTYQYWDVDGLLDLPVGPGVVTAQFDIARWNATNGSYIAALPKQTAIMAEAGYTFLALRLSPIVRYERHSFATSSNVVDTRYSAGIAYWAFLHTSNLKLFYTREHINPKPATDHDFNQIVLQWQIFFY